MKKQQMSPATFAGSLYKTHAVFCSKIADVHGIGYITFGLENLFIFGKVSDFSPLDKFV